VSESKLIFKDVVCHADQPNANGVSYSKECLEKAAKQIKEMPFGVIFKPGCESSVSPKLADAAFSIEDTEFDGEKLMVTISPMDTSDGKMARAMLEANHDKPGLVSLGMAGTVNDGDKEEVDGVLMVNKFNCERISMLLKKDKA